MDEDVSSDVVIINTDSRTMSAREWARNNEYDPHKLFKNIFIDDIKKLVEMSINFVYDIPIPIILAESIVNQRSDYLHEQHAKTLNLKHYITMFLDSVYNIREKIQIPNPLDYLIWDKDDDDLMDFVVACSNIRSNLFRIPFESYFVVKGMAGNIIPAIATSNAIIAGQIVIHVLRV